MIGSPSQRTHHQICIPLRGLVTWLGIRVLRCKTYLVQGIGELLLKFHELCRHHLHRSDPDILYGSLVAYRCRGTCKTSLFKVVPVL